MRRLARVLIFGLVAATLPALHAEAASPRRISYQAWTDFTQGTAHGTAVVDGQLVVGPPAGTAQLGGTEYEFTMDWAVQRFVSTNNADGGTFSIMVDGALLVTGAAGPTTGMTPIYGSLTAPFTPAVCSPGYTPP